MGQGDQGADGQLRLRSRRNARHYLETGDAHALCRLAGMARGRGEEVFATPLPRQRAEPGKRAVGPRLGCRVTFAVPVPERANGRALPKVITSTQGRPGPPPRPLPVVQSVALERPRWQSAALLVEPTLGVPRG
jgi:hypothetical protein